MKSFKEYYELREEAEYAEQMLNEDPLTIAASVLGYALVGLALGWGGALIVQGYSKLANKTIQGIRKAIRKITGKDKSAGEVNKAVRELKTDNKTKIQKEKQDDERKKYINDFNEVFKAIEEKDAAKTKEALKGVKVDPKVVNRMVILEATKVFGEPPLHYGNTGNETYLFIKKVLGMKPAQAASFVVKEAFKNLGTDLVQDVEKIGD